MASDSVCKKTSPPLEAKDTISKGPVDESSISEISNRLHTTRIKSSHTKPDCKPRAFEPPNQPGLGLKMCPKIEGLEERFRGKGEPQSISERLYSATTKSTRARKEPLKILLYPERTLLTNTPKRIQAYQENGLVAKQETLERREKWYR
ncbi:DgyrCDS8903 [Dimorphilus gyrociliatus]|uniref:DgyrCDS8903 n=1 Tax=Dimorphilus gyrociliatus TaxID=2664684 RepID=A0A7I8VX10_9ANNE|nr:DgyrCDS8903 [Dimorphilus gyrociliatus]